MSASFARARKLTARNCSGLLIIICTVFIGASLSSCLNGQNTMKPKDSLKTSKDRSPGQIFTELAQSNGVYVAVTDFSTTNSKSPPIFQQVFYANKSNALLRITINKDEDNIVSGNKDMLRNIVYVQGKAFDWIEGETTGYVYKATMDDILEYLSFFMGGAGILWGAYQNYLYDPSRYTVETHNDVLTLKTKTEMDKYIIRLCVLQKPFIWISSFELVPNGREGTTIRAEISLPKNQQSPPSDLMTVPKNIQFEESSNPLKHRMMMNSL